MVGKMSSDSMNSLLESSMPLDCNRIINPNESNLAAGRVREIGGGDGA